MATPAPRSQAEPATAKRAEVQAAVLRATEDLLAEGASYADLSIERIATAAGISRTAFYFYFADKRELLVRLSENVTDELYRQAEAWWLGDSADPAAEMRPALVRIADTYREHGPLLRVLVEVSTYEQDTGDFWRGLIGRFVDRTAERIAAEQAAGRALPGDPRDLAFVLIWASERSLYQAYVNGAGEPEGVVDALAAIFQRTLYGTS